MNNLTFKNYLTHSEAMLSEEHAAPHISLTVQQVIDGNGVSNMVQIIILCQLIQLFKYGSGGEVRSIREFPTPDGALINSVKSLPNEDQVELAKFFKKELDKGYAITSSWANPSADHKQWVNWVVQSQK